MIFSFIDGLVTGLTDELKKRTLNAFGINVDPGFVEVSEGETSAQAQIDFLEGNLDSLYTQLANPLTLTMDVSAVKQNIWDPTKAAIDDLWEGDAETLSKQAQDSLKSWSLGLTSSNATEEEKKLGAVWDNISAGGNVVPILDEFMQAMTDYAGTGQPARQEQANLGVALALGIHAGMLNDEVKKNIQGGSGYPAALQKALKEEFGIKSPSSVFKNEIGKPLGEGILQGMGIARSWRGDGHRSSFWRGEGGNRCVPGVLRDGRCSLRY